MTTVQTLAGKEIVLAVTGSIAAVECVRLIHALRRKGASVQVVMSGAAAGIVSPDALTYACGRPAITRISGMVEHVTFCGDGGSAGLLVIAPCTANTISKIACAIDDTPVTTFATTAIGSGMPVIIVPAMHHSMFRHPGLTENIERLERWGIRILSPRIEEGKAKIADIDEIVLEAERAVMGKPLAGKRVLITSGPCREKVDDVRILTTRSSGMMGKELALQAFRLGADVTIVHGDTIPCVTNINAASAGEMRDAVMNELAIRGGTDIYISAAAISDFAPQQTQGKIRSGKPATIPLTPLPKLLDEVMQEYSPFTVAFKIEQKPEAPAQAMLKKGIPVVLMNHPDTMGTSNGEYELLTSHGSEKLSGSKEEIANDIWKIIIGMIH
ncbi:bifunctional phosphopantothenoylcysteine decarboxylase/phosphopantothenate--cysteine ligase CoaBC [Methanoregula sp.]|uniref:bifunctional phosphopantothenoylcysteine decarboxylase/phosphopantothenate--cysteine ligase CoaBC n=1 Tax=Methanoregula sp. TaxID=2052170 RepID=UPI000CBD3D2A|nr:bifunctional phosphopantothenoylcysteine decarboxylase/phosphopantothenate--cysteine ligase CoaBC [Methanoregula sp.]PKG33026.1 MAG: bifunctional phosphopantothenoylcysteine decarboxylase/phosphopantothenate--cysteine ligase CoaBC [Methanoregula sp.]